MAPFLGKLEQVRIDNAACNRLAENTQRIINTFNYDFGRDEAKKKAEVETGEIKATLSAYYEKIYGVKPPPFAPTSFRHLGAGQTETAIHMRNVMVIHELCNILAPDGAAAPAAGGAAVAR